MRDDSPRADKACAPTAPRPPWLALRPRPLGLAFTAVVIALMLGLGAFIVAKYRALQLHSYGEIGELYIDHLLAPYALDQLARQAGAAPARPPAPDPLAELPAGEAPVALRIWKLDGTLLYTSVPADRAEAHDPSDLRRSIRGELVETLETDGADGDPGYPVRYPYFEVYAPIHDPRTGELIAVGEVYQEATEILKDRALVELTVWAVIGLVTLGVLAMMAISARQGEQLEALLETEQRLAAQNVQLRRAAEQARQEAVRANEQVLNLVGAELHDGPVQFLGLASLMQAGQTSSTLPDGTSLRDLIATVLGQLRSIAAGLILPELEELEPSAVVDLAVARHRALTGLPVKVNNGLAGVELDAPRKVCIYRIVQEGLTNATRHGDGTAPLLTVSCTASEVVVTIRSEGRALPAAQAGTAAGGLGLPGMRRRLDAFGGHLHLEETADGVLLRATLPLA
ncbi:MAG: hypothetical protein N2Z62_12795 [Rhodobacteraceae bacterium]|nr:hypothetical protein [Paracoccaceae bacterium]